MEPDFTHPRDPTESLHQYLRGHWKEEVGLDQQYCADIRLQLRLAVLQVQEGGRLEGRRHNHGATG